MRRVTPGTMNKSHTRLNRFFLIGAFAIFGGFGGTGIASVVVGLLANHMAKRQGDDLMAGSIPILVVGGALGFVSGFMLSLLIFKKRSKQAQDAIEQKYIGRRGLVKLYFGMPLFVTAVVGLLALERLAHSIGDAAAAGVFVLVLMVNVAVSLLLYDRIPRSLILPIGLIGWMLLFFFGCWFAWYGQGAFGH